jgi:uncharacterized protein
VSPSANWEPTTQAERYPQIDALRGLALFGVLIVNIETVFRVPLLEHILRYDYGPSRADRIVGLLVAVALEFKAVTIFSFLFGVSIAIQAERSASRNVSTRAFLVRRMGWLFAMGIVHLFVVWNGDILALYTICGLLLLPALNLPRAALVLIGSAAIILPEVVSLGLPFPSDKEAAQLIGQAREVYSNGGFLSILRFRWHESWSLIVPLLVAILPRTLGLMYLGMAAWRSGILREPEKNRGKLWMSLGTGLTFGAVFMALPGLLPGLNFTAPILVVLAYTSAVLLWLKPRRASSLPGFRAIGQMALTNYLVQSIVLSFVFYGYGLGLFGRIGSASAASLGLLLYLAQIQFSKLWSARYRFGPFEWLWRSAAYGQSQPMRRTPKLNFKEL